jgi:hypothetical protein
VLDARKSWEAQTFWDNRDFAWMADSAWATHLVHPDRAFLTDLLPDLVKTFEGWEQRGWVPDQRMFWQVGHDDGMEFNIASRQTKNILSGAPCYRPSFSACMWADAMAISRIATLAGDKETADKFRAKADDLKQQVQSNLWDPKREFFFPMFRDDETDNEGNVVKKNTLVYQTGNLPGCRTAANSRATCRGTSTCPTPVTRPRGSS